MPLHETVLRNIADEAGGKVVLVTGAGCSVEMPTGLPLGASLAQRCCRDLINDHVLEEGDVANPDDLSEVADAVFERTESQAPLVARFPPRLFLTASPNRGHLLAAALLKEGAVGSILTLNFDNALMAAVGSIEARLVETLYSSQDYDRLGANNLIYLHGHASIDPEKLILRNEQLQSDQVDSYEHVLAARFLASPVVVFVGLGSPARVLTESITRIKTAVGTGTHVCYVDPGDITSNSFATLLDPDSTVQEAWIPFMDLLSDRVTLKQLGQLEQACADLIAVEAWGTVDVAPCISALRGLDLLALGRLRAEWLLKQTPYLPDSSSDERNWIAELILTIALVAAATETAVHFVEDGLVEFRKGRTVHAVVALAHARGSMSWARLDAALGSRQRRYPITRRPTHIIASGANGERTELVAPFDIIDEAGEGDIVAQAPPSLNTTEELRLDPTSVFEVNNGR